MMMPKTRRSHTPVTRPLIPGDIGAFDIVPNPCVTPLTQDCNYNYLLFCMDICTRRCEIIGMKIRNTKRVIKAIIAFEQRMGYNFKSIHSDAGTEFFSNDLLTWLQQRTSMGIPTRRHMAAPDTQWQNGFCERHWGHIKQMAHKMLVNARLPLQFLFYALQTACYIHARLPHSGLISPTGRMLSPYERQKGVPPRISQIRVFGCPVIYRMHKTLKWETSGRRGVHVGPAHDSIKYQ